MSTVVERGSDLLRRALYTFYILPLVVSFHIITLGLDHFLGEENMPTQLKSIIGSIRRSSKSNFADGRSDDAAAGVSTKKKTSVIHDMRHLGLKNTKTLADALPVLATGEPIDDKGLLLENGVSLLQGMPLESGLSEKISNGFINMLWNDLPHPPATLAGPEYRYRRHDGGNNNPWDPEMGKAGAPYSRSVPPVKPKGPNLPDVESVFEALLKRDGKFRPHPSGLNRLFFSFATVVIHECFQTSRENQWINETSSYVDLSTLYGNTEKEQVRVRTRKNGLIYPDSIASERIMMMPPGVVAVLMLFSRNHNVIAESLLSINEDGAYKPWEQLNEEKRKWQDEDIFQLARNINVGFFASVVLKDYVAAILNTPRANSEWSLDLGKEMKEAGKRVERGSGNVVSVEFAVLYHWHAALSAADADWMETVIRSEFPRLKSIDDVTPEMFYQVMGKHVAKLYATEARTWTFGGLKRQQDGRFKDSDLAEVIKNCIEEPAHAFGARGTPASLKVVDILGQLQARNQFNVCTMNEFRRYLNLKAYDNFEEWNPDPDVAKAAELLYGHIENLELYPGLMAECTKPAMPGSGVCPGQTTGRGILDDAVALVRGDRFLSYDFNSNTLTHWGAAKLGNAAAGGAYGGVLPTLLFSSLPGAFSGTGIYGLLPFYTPDASKGIVAANKVIHKYDLSRPSSDMDIVSIQTSAGVKAVFNDHNNFTTLHGPALKPATHGKNLTNGATTNGHSVSKADPTSLHEVFFEDGFEKKAGEFFSSTVRKLVKKNSLHFSRGRCQIDIVRDVTNIAPILYLGERFAIPLKTQEQPKGLMSIYEAFTAYLVIFMYNSFDITPANRWKLRDSAAAASGPLRSIFEAHLRTQVGHGLKENLVDWMAKGSAFEVKADADRMYHDLRDTGLPVPELAQQCLNIGTPIAGYLTQQASLLIDLYLSPGYETYKARIIELSHKPSTTESERELQGFVFEGMRHAGVVPGLPRVALRDVTVTDGARGSVHIPAGRTVLLATGKAAMDPAAYPSPQKLDPLRPFGDYVLLGHGLQYEFGVKLVGAALAATLKEVFSLKNLRRAKGKLGAFSVVDRDMAGIRTRLYLDASSRESPIPTSLTLEYDG